MKTELEILEEKVNKLKELQRNCDHKWEEATYDPERREIMREEFVSMGSDPYFTNVGTGIYEYIDRWSRVCKKCGKKEYTYENEEVVAKTIKKPKFK